MNSPVLIVLLLGFLALTSAQQPTFTAGVSLGANLLPTAIYSANIDGQNGADLMFCNYSGGYLISRSDIGTWNAPVKLVQRSANPCSSIVVGNFGYGCKSKINLFLMG